MTEQDFRKLEHNPLKLKDGELMQDKYPYFKSRDTFCIPIDGESIETLSDILKFTVLFIDKNSPFWNEGSMEHRMEGALKWAKISKTSEAYKFISTQHEWLWAIVNEYFQDIDHVLYRQWVSERVALAQMHKFLIDPSNYEKIEQNIKAKQDLMMNLNTLRLSHEQTEKAMFPNSVKIKERMKKDEAKKESRQGFAEIFAKRRKEESEE
jgi:hypothetical protein